jgi:hypothetical protein
MKNNTGAQYEISIDGLPRSYRDRKELALQGARFLKSRNPNSVVKLKDLQTGEEIVVAFKGGSERPAVRQPPVVAPFPQGCLALETTS